MGNNITYIQRKHIDVAKWDSCILNAANGNIYGTSVYLDSMCDHWDGLVLNDYEAVFPLPWRKKYGISYIYQPPLVAQIGLFGNHLTAEIFNDSLERIPAKFRLISTSLNAGNNFFSENPHLYPRQNFILPLDRSYADISAAYNQNVKRNLKRALHAGHSFQREYKVDEIASLAAIHFKEKKALKDFSVLYSELQNKDQAVSYSVRSEQNELLAGSVFLFYRRSAYYILVGNNEKGRTTGASHMLIDRFIYHHAGKLKCLDFEGSDIPGLAAFYKSFGAVNETYAAIHLNRLPFFLKWIKN